LRLEEQMLEIARALLARLRGTVAAGFQIALENTPGDTPGHFGKLFALLRELNPPALPRIGTCFDIGHANLCPATRNDYLAYLGQLDDGVPIIHVHVHENWGDADSHLTLFTGPAAYDSQGVRELLRGLRRRGFAGSMILEQWPQPPTLLNRAHDRLLEIWRALDQSPVAAPLETSSTPGKLL
jgi:sugar phosphate isomerase/epimerase